MEQEHAVYMGWDQAWSGAEQPRDIGEWPVHLLLAWHLGANQYHEWE